MIKHANKAKKWTKADRRHIRQELAFQRRDRKADGLPFSESWSKRVIKATRALNRLRDHPDKAPVGSYVDLMHISDYRKRGISLKQTPIYAVLVLKDGKRGRRTF